MDLEPHRLGAGPLPFDVLDARRAPLHLGLLQVGAQLDGTVGHLEIAQQPADVARREPEDRLGLLVDHRDGVLAGHHDLGHRAGPERQIAHRCQPRQVGVAFVERARRVVVVQAAVAADRLAEDPVLEAQRGEPVTVAEQHLGVPQKQRALRGKRKMQAPQHISLGLGVQIHQRVAAHQQVHPGDRRILDQVVAAEDHRPAQILVKNVAAVDLFEVAGQQIRRHRLDRPGVVGGAARLGQRVLVDVGGIDLHPLPERVEAQRLGQQHRQRVGLLARGAPRTPHPDRIVGPAFGQQSRNDFGGDELPGVRVAEERGDVDQDGVEQRGELVGAGLQEVQVLVEGGVARLVHPVPDAAHQRGALVAGEVEAARIPHVPQQGLECLVGLVSRGIHPSPV
ncbi:hypothetical protein PICSAR164_02743 [Mycobacterium avium subsp. paratuberculosis]|nr:hypothetical protein PICSAR164_02743 [Mycobacterium avium subsp. paratuberculosis]